MSKLRKRYTKAEKLEVVSLSLEEETIKYESLDRYKFTTMNQVYSVVFKYIDGWYNTMRIHTTLGDLFPKERFSQLIQLESNKKAA